MGQIRDEILLKKISQVIKSLRNESGVTLEDFYNETNIHLARIEAGKLNVTVSTLNSICGFFKISLSEFFIRVENQ